MIKGVLMKNVIMITLCISFVALQASEETDFIALGIADGYIASCDPTCPKDVAATLKTMARTTQKIAQYCSLAFVRRFSRSAENIHDEICDITGIKFSQADEHAYKKHYSYFEHTHFEDIVYTYFTLKFYDDCSKQWTSGSQNFDDRMHMLREVFENKKSRNSMYESLITYIYSYCLQRAERLSALALSSRQVAYPSFLELSRCSPIDDKQNISNNKGEEHESVNMVTRRKVASDQNNNNNDRYEDYVD